VFQGLLAVAIILIDDREKPIVSWALNFRVRMLLKTTINKSQSHETNKLMLKIQYILYAALLLSFIQHLSLKKLFPFTQHISEFSFSISKEEQKMFLQSATRTISPVLLFSNPGLLPFVF